MNAHGNYTEGEKQKYNYRFTYFLRNTDNLGDSPQVKFGNNFIFTSEFTIAGPDLELLDASPLPPMLVCISCLRHTLRRQTKDKVWEKNGKSQQPASSHSRYLKWIALPSTLDNCPALEI